MWSVGRRKMICLRLFFAAIVFALAQSAAIADVVVASKNYVDSAAVNKVSKTGNETVAGTKTFSSIPQIPTASLPTL